MKYVIISNRLPITVKQNGETFTFSRSGGGLATGLDSLQTNVDRHWIGWCGVEVDDDGDRRRIAQTVAEQKLHPVFLNQDQIENFYEGYCNSTIWPLCHYFYSYIVYNEEYRRTYREVNELFCREAVKVIEPGDLVWVNDYQLMLLPAMIRERVPEVGIGYFHHIPFPSYELFRCLPERADILKGLLGADLIGFHTYDYMRHFISAAYRVLNLECRVDQVHMQDRVAETEAFPMGINYHLYHDAITKPEVQQLSAEMRSKSGKSKIILSVDRLDYTKGILNRLKSFAAFLDNHPEYLQKVTLIMVVVPSRDTVGMYAELKVAIDQEVGAINGRYANMGWMPVHYYYRSFSLDELTAMYYTADVALVTPLRDGMNLVAKEYLATKRDNCGVLILSEMAGAADQLRDALIVNPTDAVQIEQALVKALEMPEKEQKERLERMQTGLQINDVNRWAQDFMHEIAMVKRRNDGLRQKILDHEQLWQIQAKFVAAGRRLLIFDYDGTLTPLVADPDQAVPSPLLLRSLHRLVADPANTVVICSGRDMDFLERWFPNPRIRLSAEHGAFYRVNGEWHGECRRTEWGDDLLDILDRVVERTPGSKMESKLTSLVWHYRNVEPWLAELRVNQLMNVLMQPCAQYGLHILRGKKNLEIKLPDYNKGQEVCRLVQQDSYDFILAIGDDVTDEDMFSVLDETAITIKVGKFSDKARFTLPTQEGVQPLLDCLSGMETVTRTGELFSASVVDDDGLPI